MNRKREKQERLEGDNEGGKLKSEMAGKMEE